MFKSLRNWRVHVKDVLRPDMGKHRLDFSAMDFPGSCFLSWDAQSLKLETSPEPWWLFEPCFNTPVLVETIEKGTHFVWHGLLLIEMANSDLCFQQREKSKRHEVPEYLTSKKSHVLTVITQYDVYNSVHMQLLFCPKRKGQEPHLQNATLNCWVSSFVFTARSHVSSVHAPFFQIAFYVE